MSSPPPAPRRSLPARRLVLACFGALIALGIAWEMWLAPLRPGGSLLVLKVVPLIAALPALLRGRVRAYQWWSMLVLVYVAEGAVRATSDRGPGAALGACELALSLLAFAAILGFVRARRLEAGAQAAGTVSGSGR